MIYDFTILVGNHQTLYLTAKDKREFYSRCLTQYRLSPNEVHINREIEEDDIPINKTSSPIPKVENTQPQKTNLYEEKAKEIMKGSVYSLNEKELMDKRLHGWNVQKLTSVKKELAELLTKHDRVKLYYEASYSRKDKKYLALYK